MLPAELDSSRRRLWLFVGLLHLALACMLLASKVSLAAVPFWRAYGLLLLPVFILLFARARGMTRLFHALEPVVAGLLVTVPLLVATYVALGTGLPLADDRLASLDHALGFDARAAIALVDGSALASHLLQLCYASLPFQLMIVPFWLGLRNQPVHAHRFVVAYAVLCALASLVAVWFPALGTYVHYDIDVGRLRNIDATFGFFFLDEFNRLRGSEAFVLEIDRAAGILTFPSVHAGSALLCAWGGWKCPLLRPFALLLNTGMAISAVTHGSHFVVDVLAGLAVAALAIAVADFLLGRRAARGGFAAAEAAAPLPGVAI